MTHRDRVGGLADNREGTAGGCGVARSALFPHPAQGGRDALGLLPAQPPAKGGFPPRPGAESAPAITVP